MDTPVRQGQRYFVTERTTISKILLKSRRNVPFQLQDEVGGVSEGAGIFKILDHFGGIGQVEMDLSSLLAQLLFGPAKQLAAMVFLLV